MAVPKTHLPVAVIGAGPVGLAAAAHLYAWGIPFAVLEAGDAVGANLRRWAHVRMFSPWQYVVDPVAAAMLADAGWAMPDPEGLPTGADLAERYLQPLADLPEIRPHLRLGALVLGVTRLGMDKVKTAGRADAPFLIRVRGASRREEQLLARAVVDASGTYHLPNPAGAGGISAPGEAAAAERIFYGIPDVLGAQRDRYAGRRTLVVGAGHSAANALLELARLAEQAEGTKVIWAIRRPDPTRAYGGGDRDQLPARGRLGRGVQRLVEQGKVRLAAGFRLAGLRQTDGGMVALGWQDEPGTDGVGAGGEAEIAALPPVDQIVVATGGRPDLEMLRELRLALDPVLESPAALADHIDPNLHSCGTVPPHGWDLLRHPAEPDFYLVGAKSYGRAPTFLLLTGYEQVRSVVAAIAGDMETARAVALTLPQTGVCSGGGAGCCA